MQPDLPPEPVILTVCLHRRQSRYAAHVRLRPAARHTECIRIEVVLCLRSAPIWVIEPLGSVHAVAHNLVAVVSSVSCKPCQKVVLPLAGALRLGVCWAWSAGAARAFCVVHLSSIGIRCVGVVVHLDVI